MLNLVVKVKVQFTLEQATKGQRGEVRYSSNLSLTSALGEGGWPTPRPAALPRRKRPGTHRIGGWVGPSTGQDGCGKSRPHRD
jgi:hypothetical protein